ncbi:hypothetical protein ACHAQH_003611 [Verticillium albo-atrum]
MGLEKGPDGAMTALADDQLARATRQDELDRIDQYQQLAFFGGGSSDVSRVRPVWDGAKYRSGDEEETGSASTTTGSATGDSDRVSATPTPSGLSDDDGNIDLFNATIPEGHLPLQPEITPGWAVSGVLLLISGAIYALIGIKNPWLHTFFSTAYLASLGTAVLIVYVMEPPISSGIQGAYVVAVALTGLILGGVTTFFKEVTEGFGCMLGGFCLSMWLLCLKPGGLLPASSSKIVFIACLTLGSFGFYFSRYTRDYALIVCISFSGATVAVLGIDCFSRAGLKEFWAYIWDLNENIFPLGATTYPMTRGIRVEIAAIILICLAGIISQMKLWRIIKERRAERAAKRAEGQRNLEAEEANVGRQIEAENARERREWERAYGNGETQSTVGSSDSVTDCEKNIKGTGGSKSSRAQSTVQVQAIEMDDMQSSTGSADLPVKKAAEGIMVSPEVNDGMVTVRVARDDDTLPAAMGEAGEDLDEKRPPVEERELQSNQPGAKGVGYSSADATAPAPQVVPLPFKVPTEEEKGQKQDDDRSSVATFADEAETLPSANKRHSMAKRLSQSSIQLLRRVSHRTSRSIHHDTSNSQEDLVPQNFPRDDDDGSVAATMDIASLDGDDRSVAGESRRSIEINAEFADKDEAKQASELKQVPALHNLAEVASPADKHISTAETVATDILNATQAEESGTVEVAESTAPAKRTSMSTAIDAALEEATLAARSAEISQKVSEKGKSVVSVESTPASLTQERLPNALSRVAMSYRTNEWAKHLSHADMPEPETLQLNDYAPEEAIEHQKKEIAKPLNVEELQQTATTGTPAPNPPPQSDPRALTALTRADSRQSSKSAAVPSGARETAASSAAASAAPSLYKHSNQSGALNRQPSMTGMRRMSTNLHIQPITEESHDIVQVSRRDSSGANCFTPSSPVASFVADRSPVPGVVSYSSPQTLLGQREMFLRNKSNPSLPGTATMPDLYTATRTPSESGSLYNYPTYGSQPLPQAQDDDDIPMAQRKELMRQSGLLRSSGSYGSLMPGATMYAPSPAVSVESLAFDSHQPQRYSTLPSEAARQSQLANFRQSVQSDLRSGAPLGGQGSGRETPFHNAQATGAGGNDLKRSLDVQRSLLLSQKEAEAQRREMERWEKERGDRAFAARMQSGDLMEAHRDIMRRMQGKANVKDE